MDRLKLAEKIFVESMSLWSQRNLGAVACVIHLLEIEEVRAINVLQPICMAAGLTGSPLYLLWNDYLDRDTALLSKFLTANPHDSLSKIAAIGRSYNAGEIKSYTRAVSEHLFCYDPELAQYLLSNRQSCAQPKDAKAEQEA